MTIKAPRVGIIGAGISGVASAAQLKRVGADVTVFERSHAAGGVWLFDERVSIEPEYSERRPSKGDNFSSYDYIGNGANEARTAQVELLHAPPGPCYEGLTNNVSTRLLQTTLLPFPENTPDWVSHSVLGKYIQSLSQASEIDQHTLYRTRVEEVAKRNDVWVVRSSSFERDENDNGFKLVESNHEFDHVVVATGHYHAPVIPNLPGLEEIKRRWPNRILHSKNYRRPDRFKNKKLLLIGAGVSSVDIAKESSPFAKQIYQSSRLGDFDLPATALPENAVRLPQVSSFHIKDSHPEGLDGSGPLPINILLSSGDQLCGIDYIILCTGYTFSLPFLRNYHDDAISYKHANETILVTSEGRQIHNLHHDIFYIPDPTLMFVGIPFYTATFSLFDYQAIVVAAVVSGRASLPSREQMRVAYLQRVAEKGFDRHFHSLKGQEDTYVAKLLNWINADLEKSGNDPIAGYSDTWLGAKAEQMARFQTIMNSATTASVPHYVPTSCS